MSGGIMSLYECLFFLIEWRRSCPLVKKNIRWDGLTDESAVAIKAPPPLTPSAILASLSIIASCSAGFPVSHPTCVAPIADPAPPTGHELPGSSSRHRRYVLVTRGLFIRCNLYCCSSDRFASVVFPLQPTRRRARPTLRRASRRTRHRARATRRRPTARRHPWPPAGTLPRRRRSSRILRAATTAA